MRISLISMALIASAISMNAFAQDDVATTPTSTAEEGQITRGVFDSAFKVTPRAGVLGFGDSNQSYTSRAIVGFTADYNLASVVPMPDNWNVGIESGFLFSHTGSPGANFVGTNSTTETTPGSNSFIVPLLATMNYKPSDKTIVGINLGPSLVYRSIGSSMTFGRSGDGSSGSAVDIFPDIGLNAGYAVSQAVGLSLRGDYILTPAQDIFTATLGASFGIS